MLFLRNSDSWDKFKLEVQRIRNVLVNNNFPISKIDLIIGNFLKNKIIQNSIPKDTEDLIYLYYRNQFTNNYKNDEKLLNDIIKKM